MTTSPKRQIALFDAAEHGHHKRWFVAMPASRYISFYSAFILLLCSGLVCAGSTGLPDETFLPDEAHKQAMINSINSTNEKDGFIDQLDADVWLVGMSARLTPFLDDEKPRLNLLRMIHSEASRAKIPAELVLSVIEVESHFNRFKISESGALGYMQIMPFWLNEIGKKSDSLFDPRTNLRYGCTILKYYLDIEKGNVVSALALFNNESPDTTKFPALVLGAYYQHWTRN